MNHPTRALDVSRLPESAMDHRSLVWWGNTLLMFIETTVFALLVASYLYVRMNFTQWPPVQSSRLIPVMTPYPSLGLSSFTLGTLLLSIIPALCADRAALRLKTKTVAIALTITIVAGVIAAGLRFRELIAFPFSWDENAYASIIWTIGGTHLLHITIGTLENVIMLTWLCFHGMDKKHARDVRVNAAYWYWVVGIWVPLYGIIYFGPRFH